MNEPTKKELSDYMNEFHIILRDFIRTLNPKLNKYNPFIKVDWSESRTNSRGGWYEGKCNEGVNYAMLRLTSRIKEQYFIEYASFSSSIYIGSVSTCNWKLIANILACHEQAHAICAYINKDNKERHGNLWKSYYKDLREKFVNKLIYKYPPIISKKIEKKEISNKLENYYFKYCETHNLKKEWFNKVFNYGGRMVKIIGWRPRARKYFVLIEREDNNKKYHTSPEEIIFYGKRQLNGV